MIKKIIFLLCLTNFLFLSKTSFSSDYLCRAGELQIDIYKAPKLNSNRVLTVRIHGTIETPNSGYAHEIKIENISENNVVYGHLFLYESNQNLDKAAVISAVNIDREFEISLDTKGVFFGVVKDFNWGATLFYAELGGSNPVCLKQEAF